MRPAIHFLNIQLSNSRDATWKSKASGWKYSGKLQGVDDVRALAFKIYANEGEKVTGSVTISDFSFEF